MKLSWGKHSLATVLSIGFMVIGTGCIFWAMYSLWIQPNYYADATGSHYSMPNAFTAERNTLIGNRNARVESEVSLVLPALRKPLYPIYPAEGDNIGSLSIPALERVLPIFQGTGVKELEKGVGHFNQSVLPGEEDNCVLSGHRETVFRQLDKLKIGDQLIVQTAAGIFTYEVNGTRIVREDDKTVIVPTEHAVLTLTTCYPFNTPGYFPDRYIVSAVLVKSNNVLVSSKTLSGQ